MIFDGMYRKCLSLHWRDVLNPLNLKQVLANPMATADDRKKRIMEHLARSSGEFVKRSANASNPDRKKQVMDHIQRTRG